MSNKKVKNLHNSIAMNIPLPTSWYANDCYLGRLCSGGRLSGSGIFDQEKMGTDEHG